MKNLLFILILIFTINFSHSFEKVVVPDYVDKKTKSPWNFYENFEEEKYTVHSNTSNLTIN